MTESKADKKKVSKKISLLVKSEDVPVKQAAAIAYSMLRRGELDHKKARLNNRACS